MVWINLNSEFAQKKIRLWLAFNPENNQIEKTEGEIYLPNINKVIFKNFIIKKKIPIIFF